MNDKQIDLIRNELNDIVKIFDANLEGIKDTHNQINQMIETQQNTLNQIKTLTEILKG